MHEAEALAGFRRQLRNWYARNGRDLAWRRTRDPYRVWVSEIMLQQTTVAAVAPYFERFLARFPNVAALADAAEEDVLRLWEGLGYYSRARNLRRAAERIVHDYGGRFPHDAGGLQRLPGIGRYTAGAIVSFAFDRPAAIVEANTLRLYCRLLGYAGDPRSSAGQRVLWEFAERLVPRRSPGRFNQALMELGATVCRPAAPDCSRCPVRRHCVAFGENTQDVIPRAAARPAVTQVTEAMVAISRRGRFLLRRRPPSERWAGLWDFPRFELNGSACDGDSPAVRGFVEEQLQERHGVAAAVDSLLTEMRHGVTRYRIRLLCFAARYVSRPRRSNGEELRWTSRRELTDLPLSTTGRRMARLLCEQSAVRSQRSAVSGQLITHPETLKAER
ncbi:MAG: A/G-specific adenine glycosylase [Planctomycetes bacterium]|nr:A/G-specific adenine glycosylase [Planctomycetota bacterium]